MWRQTALTLARCTRSILSRPGLYSGRVQAEWAPNAVLLSGSSSRFTPHLSEVRPLRAFSYDVAESTSGTLFASQGEGFSRYGEKHLEEERSASSYGGMLSTFFATRANLERRLQEVLSQGEKASEAFVNKLLRACSEELHTETPQARVALAKDMWSRMKEAGLPLGVSLHNTMINVHLYNRQPFSPKEFLEEMKEAGVMPNQETLFKLLLEYCHRGDIEGSKQILQHAKSAGMSLTEQVYSAFILGKGRAGDLEGARSVLTMMKEKDISAGTESYGALAAAFAELGDMEGVEKILQEMQGARVFPNHTVYLGLLEALGMYDHHEHMPAVLKRIRNKKWLLTDLRKLMLFFAGAHKFEACVHLLSTLLHYGPFIELMSFNYCLRAVTGHMINAGTSHDIVLQLSQRLASIGGQASVTAREDLMLIFYKQKDLDAVFSYARTLADQGIPVKAQHLYPALATCSEAGQREGLVAALRTVRDLQLPIERVLFEIISTNGNMTTTEVMELLKEAEVLDDVLFCSAFVRFLACSEENKEKMTEVIEALLKSTSLTAEEVQRGLINRITGDSDVHLGYGSPSLLHPVFELFGKMELKWDQEKEVLSKVTDLLEDRRCFDAIRMAETLLQMGVMPRDAEATFTAILESVVESGEVVHLLKFLKAMKRHQVPINDHHVNLVAMVTNEPVSTVDEAFAVLRPVQGSEVTGGSASSELDRLIASKRVADAIMLFEQKCQAGEEISKHNYISLLELVLSMGGVEMAEQIRSEMTRSGHPEYVKVRNFFVKAYARKGDFEKAKAELKEANLELQRRQGKTRHSKEGYSLLLRGYESHNDPKGMLAVVDEMVADGLPIPGAFFNLTIKALLRQKSVDEAFSLAVNSSSRFGLTGVLGGHIEMINQLVADEDYDRVKEVTSMIEQSQDKSAVDHVLLFAELKAGHSDKAREIGQSEGFIPKAGRLRQFHAILNKLKKPESVLIVEELMNVHGVSVEEEDPGISEEGSKKDHYLDVHAKENPTGVATDLEGGTTAYEDVSLGSDSGQEVGVTTSEDNPDTVKS